MKSLTILMATAAFLFSVPLAKADTFKTPPQDLTQLSAPLEIGKNDEERARNLVKTFRAACFFNNGSNGKMINWAATHFKELPEEEQQAKNALGILGIKTGRVWFGNFPGGEMEMITEDNANCHLIGLKVDEQELHSMMKTFSNEIARNLKDKKITFKTASADGDQAKISEILMDQSAPPVRTAIFASVQKNGPAIISLKNLTTPLSTDDPNNEGTKK